MTIRVPSLYLAGVTFILGVGSAGFLMSPAPSEPSTEKRAALPAPPATAMPTRAASVTEPECRHAAWPYTSPHCSETGPDRPVRQVRVIPTGQEPEPSMEIAAAAPAAPPLGAVAAPPPAQASAPPAGRDPAVTGSIPAKIADAGPPAPVAITAASVRGLDQKAQIGPAPARADAQPGATPSPMPRAAAPTSAGPARVAASAATALSEAPQLPRGTGAETAAKPVTPASQASLAPAEGIGAPAEPASGTASVPDLRPAQSGPPSVLPVGSPQPATARIAAATQEVRPVPPEGVRPAETVAPERVAERSPEPAREPQKVAERSPEPAREPQKVAESSGTSPAADGDSRPLPPPAERSRVATAEADPLPSAPVALERQEPRAERKATRRRGERGRLAARREPARSGRVEAPRYQEAARSPREADRLAEAPSGRQLQVLRLRVYDYPDGTRIAVNPRTGETYTAGSSRRAERPSSSVMGWLAGDDD